MKLLGAAVLVLSWAAVPALAQRTPVPTPTPRPTPRATIPPPPPTATPVPPPPTATPTPTPFPSPGPTQAGTPAPSPAPTPAPTSPPGASPTATPAATPSFLRGPAQITISVKNAPPGSRIRFILTAPDNAKRHTFEADVVGAAWGTGVSINGFPSGSYAELLVIDPLGNVVNRETTTLP